MREKDLPNAVHIQEEGKQTIPQHINMQQKKYTEFKLENYSSEKPIILKG